MKKIYYIYILLCENNCYYTGYTTDLPKRYQAHQDGRAAKYTRAFPPKQLVAAWQINGSLSAALKIEAFLKKHSRAQKQLWVAEPNSFIKILTTLDIVDIVCLNPSAMNL